MKLVPPRGPETTRIHALAYSEGRGVKSRLHVSAFLLEASGEKNHCFPASRDHLHFLAQDPFLASLELLCSSHLWLCPSCLFLVMTYAHLGNSEKSPHLEVLKFNHILPYKIIICPAFVNYHVDIWVGHFFCLSKGRRELSMLCLKSRGVWLLLIIFPYCTDHHGRCVGNPSLPC